MRSGVSSAARFVGLMAVIADSKLARFFFKERERLFGKFCNLSAAWFSIF